MYIVDGQGRSVYLYTMYINNESLISDIFLYSVGKKNYTFVKFSFFGLNIYDFFCLLMNIRDFEVGYDRSLLPLFNVLFNVTASMKSFLILPGKDV